jgi:hypothetical protein
MSDRSQTPRPTARPWLIAGVVLAALSMLAFGPCAAGKRAAPSPGRALAEGESIGKIDPSSAVTGVAGQVHTLLTVECVNGQLNIRATVENVSAKMNCSDLQPAPAFVPFYGKQVSITNGGDTVVIANDTEGSIAIKATDPHVTEVVSPDATP